MIDSEYVERLRARIDELETQMSQPDAVRQQKVFAELVREHGHAKTVSQVAERVLGLQREIAEYEAILADADSDTELRELAEEELPQLQAQLPKAEREVQIALLPPDVDGDRGAIVEIRAGTGGDEAALFAGDLYRMYSRFAEIRGWKVGVIDASGSDLGGQKEIVFSVEGPSAYKLLQFESGGHRVQRIPVTESSGRIHTSAATVAVFPEVEEVDEVEIKSDDLRIDTFCSTGPGGQSVNTTQSAVRITHIPTGIVSQCQDEKSQHRNKDKAMKVLRSRLLDQMRREEAEKMGSERRDMIGTGDRSERIRTYNFPQNRITDHRINLTLYSLDRVIEGDLAELLQAVQDHDLETRLKHAMAEEA